MPAPVRTEAVLLQQNQSHPRPVGAPAPGANGGHAWGMDCARPVRTEAVLLQHNQSHLRTVGAPAPGAKGDLQGTWICVCPVRTVGGAPTTEPQPNPEP